MRTNVVRQQLQNCFFSQFLAELEMDFGFLFYGLSVRWQSSCKRTRTQPTVVEPKSIDLLSRVRMWL